MAAKVSSSSNLLSSLLSCSSLLFGWELSHRYLSPGGGDFWPNYLVTGQMFKALLQTKQNAMIVGSTGISKKAAIFFFCHFASFINKFVFEASQAKNIQEELKILREMRLLCDPPKYWYDGNMILWDYPPDCYYQDNFWLFSTQMPQIPQQIGSEYFRKMKNSEQAFNKVRGQYSAAGIIQRVIINNFDDHSQNLINFHHTPKQKFQQQGVENGRRFDQAYHQNVSMASIKYLTNYSRFGESILLITNTSHPRYIMEQRKERNDSSLSFNLMEEGKSFQQIEIKFRQNLKEQWARIDFSHLIWFDIERQCRYYQVSSEQINELKELFYKNIVDLKFNAWDKIYTTQTFKFQNKMHYKQFEFDFESTIALLEQISDFYKRRSFTIIKEKIERCICQPRLTFMHLLYVYAQKNISNPNFLKISEKGINEAMKKQYNETAYQHYFDIHWLPVKYDSANETIEFEWNARQLVAFVKEAKPLQQFSIRFPLAVYIIREGARVRFGPDKSAEFEITKIQSFGIKYGLEARTLQKGNVKSLYFISLFQMAKRYPLKYIGVVPQYYDKLQYRYPNYGDKDSQSLLKPVLSQQLQSLKPDHIDFVIAKYDNDEKLYEIYSFLIVVDSARLQEKLKRSEQFLAEFTMRRKFKFTHVMILTDYDSAKEYPQSNIIYRNFNEINVQAMNEEYKKKYEKFFQHFRKVVKINEMASQL